MDDSPPARHSQPETDGPARFDIADRCTGMEFRRQPGDRETEATDRDAGGAAQCVPKCRFVAGEVCCPRWLQFLRSRELDYVVEQGAGILAWGTDCAHNRGQRVALERTAQRARRQREYLAHIIDAFAL